MKEFDRTYYRALSKAKLIEISTECSNPHLELQIALAERLEEHRFVEDDWHDRSRQADALASDLADVVEDLKDEKRKMIEALGHLENSLHEALESIETIRKETQL